MSITIPRVQYPGPTNTGIRTIRVAQPVADTSGAAWGQAAAAVGGVIDEFAQERQKANDATAMIEIEGQMRDLTAQQMQFQHENQDQELWGDNWAKLTGDFEKNTLSKARLSRQAQLAMSETFGRYSQGQSLQIQQAANQQADRRFTTSMQTRIQMAKTPEEIAGLRPLWVESGRPIDEFDAIALPAQRQKAGEVADNRFKSALLTGSESEMDAALQYGQKNAGWDEDYLKAKRLSGLEGILRTKDSNQSRSEAEFLGNLMYRKAQGEVIVPSQVEAWVKENKIDKDTGARLIVALKSEQGAMQGEFYDFLRESVDSYDPVADPDGTKAYEIQKQAVTLGLNQHQYSFFETRLDRARKLNGPQRAQQVVLNAGKKVISEMMKDAGQTRTWDTDAESLLKDPAKLEAFGIPEEKAKEIRKLVGGSEGGIFTTAGAKADKSKGLELFRQQSKTRAAVKPASLTDAEWGKMQALMDDVTIDPNAAFSAEFNRAILEEGLESWYQHELNTKKVPPSEKEVKAWVGDKTRAVLQGANFTDLFTPAPPAPPPATSSTGTGLESQRYTRMDDGSYQGIASSYGYEGDADNGYNSLGMLRGEQPWHGQLPTVALAPRMAEELGVSLPRRKKDGWDWSGSVVEIEANGRKTKAIYDENGMYMVDASKNKLVDLTPEASQALGLPTKTNANVIVRKPKA